MSTCSRHSGPFPTVRYDGKGAQPTTAPVMTEAEFDVRLLAVLAAKTK